MNKLAKEINEMLLNDKTISEYLKLKNEIESDEYLTKLKNELDILRKDICKNKTNEDDKYYKLLSQYKNDARIRRYEILKLEVRDFFVEISDILSLK